MNKRVGLCLAIISPVIFLIAPAPAGLTEAGFATIGLTLFFLILLVSEALPLSVSCLLTVGLAPLVGVTGNFAGAVVGFAHPVIFFIIASFGIAGAVTGVPLTKRVLLLLLKRIGPGGQIEKILFALMAATAIVSFFLSNVPTCAIMMAVALEFVNLLDEAGRKSVGKTFMIAIPVATMIGGMATPASSSLNLLAISFLEQHTGETITFIQWMAVGVPLVVVLLPLAWFLMLKVYRPAQIDPLKFEEYIKNMHCEKMQKKEIIVTIIMFSMLALWIASSWVREIEIFSVALLGCVLFFLPGIKVLTWDRFISGINFDVTFISGVVLSIASAFVENNVSGWLAETLHPVGLSTQANALVGLAALTAFAFLLVITSAPALITVLAGPFITIAALNGVPPAFLIMALAFCAGNCYLLPLDTVQLITYSKGYYRMTDMFRSTIFLQIAIALILMFWIPFIGRIVL